MNINILNEAGNNSVSSLLNSNLAGAFLSGLLALCIFILGNYFKKQTDKKREIKKIKETEAFLRTSIDGLALASIRQVQSLKEFIESIKDEAKDNITLNLISGFNPSELFIINRAELYRALVSSRNGDIIKSAQLFTDFRNNVLLLIDIQNDLQKYYIDFAEKKIQYSELFYESYKSIIKHFLELEQQNKNKNSEYPIDSFYVEFSKIMNSFNTFDININTHYSNLILPLKKLIYDPVHRNNSNIILFFDDVIYCEKHYKNYTKNSKHHQDLSLEYITSIESGIKHIIDSYAVLIENKLL